MKYVIKSKTDTQKLAKKIASQLKGGEIIGFIGDLGAGKTTFIQYLAKALGIKDIVNSPTFNIIKVYPVKCRFSDNSAKGGIISQGKPLIGQLVHVDAYRLNSPEELEALGVQEYFEDDNTITVIEWADKVKNILPKNAMIIKIYPVKSRSSGNSESLGIISRGKNKNGNRNISITS